MLLDRVVVPVFRLVGGGWWWSLSLSSQSFFPSSPFILTAKSIPPTGGRGVRPTAAP